MEKLVSYGFIELSQGATSSRREINRKFGNLQNPLQVDRESYKFFVRNAHSLDEKCKTIEEICKKYILTDPNAYKKYLAQSNSLANKKSDSKYKFLEVIEMDVERTYNGAKHFSNYTKLEIDVLKAKLSNILMA